MLNHNSCPGVSLEAIHSAWIKAGVGRVGRSADHVPGKGMTLLETILGVWPYTSVSIENELQDCRAGESPS